MLKSCCCFRLNTAGTIIGWLGATLSFFAVIIVSVGLANLNDLVMIIINIMNESHSSEIPTEGVRSICLIALSVYLTFNLINLISSALLILGTVKERHLLLVPWLLNAGVSLICTILYYIIYLVILIANSVEFGAVAGFLIFSSLVLIFQYYIWYAIYSLYKKIQASRDQQQYQLRNSADAGDSSLPPYSKL